MMLKRYRHIILWSVAALLVAIGVLCVILLRGDSDRVRTMRDTWLLGQEHPDSALAIMQGVDTASLRGDREKALHLLFLTQAQYQAYSPECDLTRLDTLRTIFRDAPESPDKMLFLYLHGISLYDRKRYTDAIKPMLQALNIAEKENDYLYQGRICRALLNIYTSSYNVYQALKYARKSLDAFRKSGNQNMTNWALLDVSATLSNTKDYDGALSLQDSCMKIARAQKDTTFLKEICLARGSTLYRLGRYREAIDNYRFGSEYMQPPHAFAIGDIYAKLGMLDSVRYYSDLKKQLGEDIPNLDERIKYANKDYYGAHKDLVTTLNKIAGDFRESMERNVAGAESDFFENQMHEEIDRTRYKTAIFSIIIILLVAIIVISILYSRNRMRLQEAKIMNLRFAAENMQTTLQNLKERELQKQKTNPKLSEQDIAFLTNLTFSHIKEICNDKVKAGSKEITPKNAFMRINNLMESFAESDSMLADLEKMIDIIYDGMATYFREKFPKEHEDFGRLFALVVLGFDNRTIAVILGRESKTCSNKKSALANIFKRSDDPEAERLLSLLRLQH